MNWGVAATIVAAIIAVIGAAVTGRSALLAEKIRSLTAEKIAKADDDDKAGRLALDYAKDVRARLVSLEEWRETLTYDWLPQHFARDQAIERELLKLDPNANIPAATPLPPLRRATGLQ